MKNTISCDGVFDILTRAPFPTGDDSDQDVELHLSACYDCRQLAEALRPALELFHESVSPEEVNNLPGYFGELSPRSERRGPASLSEQTAVTPRFQRVRRRTPGTRSAVWRFVAGATIGVVVGLLVCAMRFTEPAPNRTVSTTDVQSQLISLLASMHAPAACSVVGDVASYGETVSVNRAAGHSLAQRCCTYCHTASKADRPKVPLEKLANACQVCHQGKTVGSLLDGA